MSPISGRLVSLVFTNYLKNTLRIRSNAGNDPVLCRMFGALAHIFIKPRYYKREMHSLNKLKKPFLNDIISYPSVESSKRVFCFC